MNGKDCVEIVTLPFHSALIEVTAWFHSDESCFQKDVDIFQCSIFGHACRGRDSVVTGMAGVRSAGLDQQQISVDHERRRWKSQQKDFVG